MAPSEEQESIWGGKTLTKGNCTLFNKSTIVKLSMTSCSVERSFSSLRGLKTFLRNTMTQERLSDLALLHIETSYVNQVISEDMDKMIDAFGQRHGRNKFFF